MPSAAARFISILRESAEIFNPGIPVAATNPAKPSRDVHLRAGSIASAIRARAKVIFPSTKPSAFAVPPFNPAKASTPTPPTVRRSTSTISPVSNIIWSIERSNPNPPSIWKKSAMSSMKSPTARANWPSLLSMSMVNVDPGPLTTSNG